MKRSEFRSIVQNHTFSQYEIIRTGFEAEVYCSQELPFVLKVFRKSTKKHSIQSYKTAQNVLGINGVPFSFLNSLRINLEGQKSVRVNDKGIIVQEKVKPLDKILETPTIENYHLMDLVIDMALRDVSLLEQGIYMHDLFYHNWGVDKMGLVKPFDNGSATLNPEVSLENTHDPLYMIGIYLGFKQRLNKRGFGKYLFRDKLVRLGFIDEAIEYQRALDLDFLVDPLTELIFKEDYKTYASEIEKFISLKAGNSAKSLINKFRENNDEFMDASKNGMYLIFGITANSIANIILRKKYEIEFGMLAQQEFDMYWKPADNYQKVPEFLTG
jgi:hypothetical protein